METSVIEQKKFMANDLLWDGENFFYNGKKIGPGEINKVTIEHFDGTTNKLDFHFTENLKNETEKLFEKEKIKYIFYFSNHPVLFGEFTKNVKKYNVKLPNSELLELFRLKNDLTKFPFYTFFPSFKLGKKLGNTKLRCNGICENCNEISCSVRFYVEKGMDPYGYILIPNNMEIIPA